MDSRKPLIMLAAGGTGGHLFPAEALGAALVRRGAEAVLATDARAEKFGEQFPPEHVHVIPSATLRGRDPLSLARTASLLTIGIVKAYRLLGRLEPRAVVGFGGYPSVPPLRAAQWRNIPTVIHEQNGVMGRANRFLASHATVIATGFPDLRGQDEKLKAKTTYIGNPIRPAAVEAAAKPYPQPHLDAPFQLLIFGGSQGARVMAEIVPQAVQRLEPHLQMRLHVTQQARGEDLERVQKLYAQMQVKAEVASFFSDLPARMAASHFIVSRSGASTVAELAAIGRPAILVPLPHALDQDQAANAAVSEKAGGAIVLPQEAFTPDRLASEIASLAADPARLLAMSRAARSIGVLDAADRLADLVLTTAGFPQSS